MYHGAVPHFKGDSDAVRSFDTEMRLHMDLQVNKRALDRVAEENHGLLRMRPSLEQRNAPTGDASGRCIMT